MWRSAGNIEIWIIIVFVLMISGRHTSLAQVKAEDKGKLRGRALVYILPDMPVPLEGVITITGRSFRQEVKTNREGRFEVEVPAGTYRITGEFQGYYPYRRAPFRLRRGEELEINIYPVWRIRAIGLTVTERGVEDKPIIYAPAPRYDVVRMRSVKKEPWELWIQYEEKKRRGREIEYDSAELSYDRLTVSAVSLRYDPRRFRFLAVGYVMVEDGKQTVRAERAELIFKAGEPIVRLELMPFLRERWGHLGLKSRRFRRQVYLARY